MTFQRRLIPAHTHKHTTTTPRSKAPNPGRKSRSTPPPHASGFRLQLLRGQVPPRILRDSPPILPFSHDFTSSPFPLIHSLISGSFGPSSLSSYSIDFIVCFVAMIICSCLLFSSPEWDSCQILPANNACRKAINWMRSGNKSTHPVSAS